MKPRIALLGLLALNVLTLAQTPPPCFDAASVKPNTIGSGGEGLGHGQERVQRTPTSLTMENVRLSSALKWAYRLQDSQISAPPWLNTNRYDILAKMDSPTPEEEFRRRLQALLTARFKIRFHRETKLLPAFALVVANESSKDRAKLEKSKDGGDGAITPIGKRRPGFTLDLRNTSLVEFADRISSSMGAAVVDQTGLKDRYNFIFDISPYIAGDALKPEDLPSILTEAVKDQLGLRLVSRKLPLEVLFIDRADSVPTAN